MANNCALRPEGSAVKVSSAEAASAGTTMPTPVTAFVEVVNLSTTIAYFRQGAGAQTAVKTDYPIPPNGSALILRDPDATQWAVILETAAATGVFTVIAVSNR